MFLLQVARSLYLEGKTVIKKFKNTTQKDEIVRFLFVISTISNNLWKLGGTINSFPFNIILRPNYKLDRI